MDVLAHQLGREDIALFYGPSLHLAWSRLGSVSGRPVQVALFLQGDRDILVVHLHNNHREKGTREVIQASLKAIVGLDSLLAGLTDDTVIVCLGDWNDPLEKIPGFAPFSNFLNSPLKTKRVKYEGELPTSCCSVSERVPSRAMIGDYVLASLPASPALNEVPLASLAAASGPGPWPQDASDHFPVFAKVRLRPAHVASYGSAGGVAAKPRAPFFFLKTSWPAFLPDYGAQ
jgi:hypothetical protein